jgi:hypothetical protein
MGATKKHRWQSYVYVQAHARRKGEFQYVQRMMMQKAAMDGAPLDACFQMTPGIWVALGDLTESDQLALEQVANDCRREGPPN